MNKRVLPMGATLHKRPCLSSLEENGVIDLMRVRARTPVTRCSRSGRPCRPPQAAC